MIYPHETLAVFWPLFVPQISGLECWSSDNVPDYPDNCTVLKKENLEKSTKFFERENLTFYCLGQG